MLAPPKPPVDPEALIPEARDRQRRRQLIVAVSTALLAGLGLAIYAVVGGFEDKGTSRGSPSAAAPLCRSSQLETNPFVFSLIVGFVGSAAGLEFTNTSGLACSLPVGTPRVLVYSNGKQLPVKQLPTNGSVPNSRGTAAHVLRPGQRAFVTFHWTNWCKSASGATLRYVFSGGLVLSETSSAPRCTAPNFPSIIRIAGPLAAHT